MRKSHKDRNALFYLSYIQHLEWYLAYCKVSIFVEVHWIEGNTTNFIKMPFTKDGDTDFYLPSHFTRKEPSHDSQQESEGNLQWWILGLQWCWEVQGISHPLQGPSHGNKTNVRKASDWSLQDPDHYSASPVTACWWFKRKRPKGRGAIKKCGLVGGDIVLLD